MIHCFIACSSSAAIYGSLYDGHDAVADRWAQPRIFPTGELLLGDAWSARHSSQWRRECPPHPAILEIVRQKLLFPLLLLIAALFEGHAAAQRLNGYLVVGPGSRSGDATTEFAGGGEFVIASTVGVGAELGVLDEHGSFGFVNVNGSLHFGRHVPRVDPFITGGYT